MNNDVFQVFTEILLSELKPALGCTEPIAIAFATAKLRGYIKWCTKQYRYGL